MGGGRDKSGPYAASRNPYIPPFSLSLKGATFGVLGPLGIGRWRRGLIYHAQPTPLASLLNRFFDDALHPCALGQTLRLFCGQRHDAAKLFPVLRDEARHDGAYLIVAHLR